MSTNSTPKTISDLKYQDFVLKAKQGEAPETIARKFFSDVFDSKEDPKVNFLFWDGDQKVYEAYIDQGSVDYLYIIQ